MAGLIPHEFGLEKRAQLIFQVNVIRNAIAGKVLPVRGLGREWASRIQDYLKRSGLPQAVGRVCFPLCKGGSRGI